MVEVKRVKKRSNESDPSTSRKATRVTPLARDMIVESHVHSRYLAKLPQWPLLRCGVILRESSSDQPK
jgi:hypothetical protein